MGRPKPAHITDPRAFGARVRKARTESGLSLRELSIPGCSASYLSRVEAGLRVPSPGVVVALATRLGVDPEDLLGRSLGHGIDATRIAAADIAARLGDPTARAQLDALLVEAQANGDQRATSQILESLGLFALEERHDERAVDLLKQALEVDIPTGPRARPALHRALGRAYAGIGDLPRSISVLAAAFEDAAAEPPDPTLMTLFGTYLANAHADSGRFGDAEAVLARVLQHEADLAPGNIVRLDWAIARTYLEEGKLGIAETYIRRILTRIDGSDHDGIVGQAHLLLARILADQGRLDDATHHLEETERLLTATAAVELVALSLDRARIALARGDVDEAETRLRQALDQTGTTEPGHAGTAYSLLAEVELARGHLDEARFLCQQAIDHMTGNLAPLYLDRAWDTLAEVEERAGNLPAALAALKSRSTYTRAH
jgi:tetratricopeptide (TPR) repeat protein